MTLGDLPYNYFFPPIVHILFIMYTYIMKEQYKAQMSHNIPVFLNSV